MSGLGPTLSPSVDAKVLREVCGHFATGVTVITAGAGPDASGTTVNSFTSVSLDPPMVLFCLHRESRLHPVIHESGTFAVNFLARPQEQLARAFAGRRTAVLGDIDHHLSTTGLPVLGGALAYLGCRVVEETAGGDHRIILGLVEDTAVLDDAPEPLIFFRGLMGALAREAAGADPGARASSEP